MSAVALSLPPSVQRRVRPLGARAYEAAVDAGVKAIREGSRWPVDTGRSLRAWRRTGSGYSSRLYNPVSYASYVEGKGSPAASTLRSSTSKMIAAARRHANTQSPRVNERAAERGLEVLRAAAARARGEEQEQLYLLFLEQRRLQGRRAPRIPARIRLLDRRIRQRAARNRRRR